MIRFRIANMSCGGCARGVTATLKEIDPAAELRIDLERREVAVEKAAADPAMLETALTSAGWKTERLAM
jgi:copper chaperone